MGTLKLDKDKIPNHLAIIMDGNGRWARKIGENRSIGHQNGVNSVRETVESCVEFGVKYLTLYAFSTENWSRPKEEVDALMTILVNSIASELPTMMQNKIKLTTVGNTDALPEECRAVLQRTKDQTAGHDKLTLNLALSYSGRWDLTRAVQKIAQQVKDGDLDVFSISEEVISRHLTTNFLPDPDLMIRTSGEFRLSNFLLWELAYTEIYISDVLWPDFTREHLLDAFVSYQKRERRYGKTGDQMNNI